MCFRSPVLAVVIVAAGAAGPAYAAAPPEAGPYVGPADAAGPAKAGLEDLSPVPSGFSRTSQDAGSGRTPLQSPTFDVASVRPNTSGDRDTSITVMPNGRLLATNATLRSLLLRAHKLHDSQLIGAAEWIDRERFDIDARTASPPPEGPESLMPALQALLAERFRLRLHTEMRPLSAYVLRVAGRDSRLGPQIQPTKADCTGRTVPTQEEIRASVRDGWPPCGMVFVVAFTTKAATGTAMQMRFRRSATSIPDLAAALQSAVGRPVVDKTGLEGRYDVEYSYSPQPADAGVQSAFGPEAPGVLAAVEEQLGLKLESERTEVPVLVIESVERPTAN
jgi:uncharacterized protein (TIGR03435 family)